MMIHLVEWWWNNPFGMVAMSTLVGNSVGCGQWLIDWLIDCLLDWLIDWLIDWINWKVTWTCDIQAKVNHASIYAHLSLSLSLYCLLCGNSRKFNVIMQWIDSWLLGFWLKSIMLFNLRKHIPLIHPSQPPNSEPRNPSSSTYDSWPEGSKLGELHSFKYLAKAIETW